jgi:peptide/nickel transport system ATP-binding protein
VTPLLELRGVSRAFRLPARRKGLAGLLRRPPDQRLQAVEDVDLSIMPGEALGLVGESGCGKSTLARLISRLLDVDAGEILLDGEPIGQLPPARFATSALRRQVQMVFQDPTESLNPRFSVFDAIADPVRQLMPGQGREAVARQVQRAAAQVGLPAELFPRFPHQLSGGQKARVGIARAMAVEPRLLVLDEPTSALDVSVQAVVLQLLMRLRQEAGVSLLFVSHDLNVVRLLCDRIAVMYLGKVVETGPAAQVFREPRHPYTRALLSAIPRLPGTPRPPREQLDGEPRSPIDPDPKACRLLGRCRFATEICGQVPPRLAEVSWGHAARCHHPLEPAS